MPQDFQYQEVEIYNNPSTQRNEAQRAEKMHWSLDILPEKNHCNQIRQNLKGTVKTVFGFSEKSGVVFYINLRYVCPL